jgi:4a-hydroxytetrahydrobiopterin dehydratase
MTDHIPPKHFRESVGAISKLPEVDDRPPAIDVRHDGVTVRLITFTDGYGGMTQRDLDIARKVSAAAREIGLKADPTAVQSLLVIPGATSRAEVMPFWRAVLGYVPRRDSPREDLVDPRDRGVPFWFERMDQPRSDGGGAIHVAVWVPYEQAEARITAAPPRAAGWCATSSRRRGGRWRTRPATRPTLPQRTAATERPL